MVACSAFLSLKSHLKESSGLGSKTFLQWSGTFHVAARRVSQGKASQGKQKEKKEDEKCNQLGENFKTIHRLQKIHGLDP